MIKLSDAILLASTKMRTHKVRTAVTILLSGLLFALLVTASVVTTGVFHSVDNFRKDSLSSRYIVAVYETLDPDIAQRTLRDPALIAEAKSRYEQLVQAKSAEAKLLGINYNQASDQPPYTQRSDGSEALNINDSNNIVHDLLSEKYSQAPAFDDDKLTSLSENYGATDLFMSEYYSIKRGSTLNTLDAGKEIFYDQSDEAETNTNYKPSLVDGNQMTIAPPEITTPFMLPNNAGWKPDGNSLPIILPQNTVEQLLQIKPLSDKASAKERLDRIKLIREEAASLSFKACYRNDSSIELVQSTLRQQKELSANAANADYQKPSLIYELPDPTKCENPTVQSDTRTDDEKLFAEKQRLFDEKFSHHSAPVSYFVTFQVVGISPSEASFFNPLVDQPTSQIRSLDDIIASLLEVNGIGQVIPKVLYDQLPDPAKYSDIFTYTPSYLFGDEDNKVRYIEFASADDANKFIAEQSCTVQYDNTCQPLGRPYQASMVFSNSAAIDDVQAKITKWSGYAFIGIMTLATIIMWIAISRTIADSRNETAVFRAIGFKRIDITMIYATYTILLSMLVVVFAYGLGLLGAYIIHYIFSPDLTVQAQYGFGGINLSKEFSLFGIDRQQFIVLAVACFATSAIAMSAPLVRNVRRNPIRDMREDKA